MNLSAYLLTLVILSCSWLEAIEKEIYIDLSTQKAFAIENGKVIFEGKISSGKKGHESPVGIFRITEKQKKHKSTLYPKPNGGASMPYMMRLSGSSVALHQGHVPPYPASHGCIRLKPGFARKMFNWADIHTKVVIEGHTVRRKTEIVENTDSIEDYYVEDYAINEYYGEGDELVEVY
jgi:hypothetical protein